MSRAMRPAAFTIALGLGLVVGPGIALLTARSAAAATQASIYCPSSNGAQGATPSTSSGSCGETVSSDYNATSAVVVASAYSLSNCDALLEAGCSQVTLRLSSPSGSDAGPWTAATSKNATGQYPQKGSLLVQIPADVANGTYTATTSIGSSAAVTETIPVEIAPSTPTNLVASADGANQVALTWDESAATGDVSFPIDYAGGTPTSAAPASLGEDCSPTAADAYSCSEVISSVSGPQAFQVSATRPQSPTSSGTVDSPGAATSDTVDVASVSSPSTSPTSPGSGSGSSTQPTSPTPGGGSTGSGTTSTGGSGTSGTSTSGTSTSGAAGTSGATTGSNSSGASTAAEAHLAEEGLSAAGFEAFTPPSGSAAIDPAPEVAGSGGSTSTPGYYPNGEPIAQGTYKATLTYPNQTTTQKVVTKTLGGRTYTDVAATTNTRLLMSFVAGGLIVLLIGAHLLAFSRRQSARIQY